MFILCKPWKACLLLIRRKLLGKEDLKMREVERIGTAKTIPTFSYEI